LLDALACIVLGQVLQCLDQLRTTSPPVQTTNTNEIATVFGLRMIRADAAR
jgi:hypothetical protein